MKGGQRKGGEGRGAEAGAQRETETLTRQSPEELKFRPT